MARLPSEIFRKNALQQGAATTGDLLWLTPRWTRWTYPLLVATFITAVLYCALGTIHEYATGPGVVWISGHTRITAKVSGTASRIEIKPGEHVEAGRLLVSFASAVEQAELTRIDRELELQADRNAASVTALQAQRDVMVARLDQLAVRAPHAGIIGDVRVRPGQLVQAGELVLTLLGDEHRCSVQAVLPAQYRPQLRRGMPLRFEVSGYSYAYQDLTITSIGAQIIGPSEVKRFLGPDLEDTLRLEGPMVLVEASPCATSFTADGQSFEFYHGMSGLAEARIRTRPILVSLVPALQVFFGNPHD